MLLMLPVLSFAQINRSAKELAGEQIQEYVTTKLFKDLSYKPIATGQLKPVQDKKNLEIAWTIEHRFEIKDSKHTSDQKAVSSKEYRFQFYLDDKMRVIKAESYFVY